MRIAAAIVFATISITPAFAQIQIPMQASKDVLTPEEQEKQDRLDRAYKAASQSRPEQKATDPWGNVRAKPQDAAGPRPAAKSQSQQLPKNLDLSTPK